MVFWSEMIFSSDVDVSNEGEKGLKQPTRLTANRKTNDAALYFRKLFGNYSIILFFLIAEIGFKLTPREISIVLPEVFPFTHIEKVIIIRCQ